MDYLENLYSILLKPIYTIDNKKDDVGLLDPIRFTLISSILSGVVSLIFQIIAGFGLQLMIILFILMILFELISIFSCSVFFHILINLFGSHIRYVQTLKVFAYVSAYFILGAFIFGVSLLLPVVSYLNIILFFFMVVIIWIGLRSYTELTTWRLIIIWLTVSLVLLILFLIISFIFVAIFFI